MKKLFISIAVAIMTIAQSSAQLNLARPQIPVDPTLQNPGSFTMIMVPDPQSYTKFTANLPLFDLQTAWIASNINHLNIKAALFTGDMVEQNNKLTNEGVPNPYNGNRTSRQQWEGVSHALSYLDNRLPYIIAQGNHDAGHISAEHRYSIAPDYIYPERNIAWERTLVATAPNWQGIHTMENSAYEFSSPEWGKLLVITFEFAPRDEILQWARTLTESERYKNDRVIILTHSMLRDNDEIIESEGYKLTPRNWGLQMWEKLIAHSHNISLVLCGHTGTPPKIPADATNVDKIDYSTNSAFRVETAADGRKIPMMMFNSQNGDGDWNGNGGDCWIRILEFLPDGETISVRTFSPMFATSKLTKHLAWRTAPYDQFSFTLPRNK